MQGDDGIRDTKDESEDDEESVSWPSASEGVNQWNGAEANQIP